VICGIGRLTSLPEAFVKAYPHDVGDLLEANAVMAQGSGDGLCRCDDPILIWVLDMFPILALLATAARRLYPRPVTLVLSDVP